MIIDAHQHFWDPATRRHAWLDDLPALRRRLGPDEYRQVAAPQGVEASVLVQVLNDVSETEEFLALAADSQAADSGRVPVAGVVGWIDLQAPDVAAEIERLRARPGGQLLVGVRHLVQDEPDPGWLDRPDVRRGLRAVGDAGLVYDLLVRPPQLPAALRVTAALDRVPFVLDHAAKPRIAQHELEPWATQIGQLAARPNVTCKVSGLVTEAAPSAPPADFAPYLAVLVESFGPARLMFGSDWPVCLLAAPYDEVLGLVRDLLARLLSKEEVESFLISNARATYRLA
jgi:L-fuconolactonase